MRCKSVLVIGLIAMLIFSVNASALAQEDKFSTRVLTKGKKSVLMLLVVNSSKSTNAINEFEVTFTDRRPFGAIARGWDSERNDNTMTFTATRSDLGPGERTIFIIKVADPASSKFDWIAKDNNGIELQNGEVSKVRVRESKESLLVKIVTPEVNVNKDRVILGEQIIVTGKGYSTNSAIIIYIDLDEVGRFTTDQHGMFNTIILVSDHIGVGPHMIKAIASTDKLAVIKILTELPEGALPPLQGGKLVIRTDKEEYSPGARIKITGSAVLDTPVSLKITDPVGALICGSNPQVNNQTLLWSTTCFLDQKVVAGTYKIDVKQIVHRTSATFIVKVSITTTTTTTTKVESGEDPGTLKISIDKGKYRVGDTVEVTITGSRSESLVNLIVNAPSSLESNRYTTDETGSVIVQLPISGSDSIGIWKLVVKQTDSTTKKHFTVRLQFIVEE